MTSSRYLIVSTDSHVGPSVETFTDYCAPQYREDFQTYVEVAQSGGYDGVGTSEFEKPDGLQERWLEQALDAGVNDPQERLKNMDADGIASEVIFHGIGTFPGSTAYIPFNPSLQGPWRVIDPKKAEKNSVVDLQHQAVGRHMYNQWLADFCATDPDRLLGVAELPFWDIDAAVKEVEWAAEHGLRCINLAAPRPEYPTYNLDVWEPFWSAVSDNDMAMNCHTGTPLHDFTGAGVAFRALHWSEFHFMGTLALPMLVFGGVFKRNPNLRLNFNEQGGYWVRGALRELDAIYKNPWNKNLREVVPMLPSEYWKSNCFLGGSFLAHFELGPREEIGVENITWGRDYPHLEGTWPHTEAALRTAFYDLPEDEVRTILGDSSIRCYRLDKKRLDKIAQRIGPDPEIIAKPLERVPEGATSLAYRDRADAMGGARFGYF